MTQIEKEALRLFKDYSHLQIKMILTDPELSEEERKVVLLALEYHRGYNSTKLDKPKSDVQKHGT